MVVGSNRPLPTLKRYLEYDFKVLRTPQKCQDVLGTSWIRRSASTRTWRSVPWFFSRKK